MNLDFDDLTVVKKMFLDENIMGDNLCLTMSNKTKPNAMFSRKLNLSIFDNIFN